MNHRPGIVLFSLFFLFTMITDAQTNAPVKLPAPEKLKLYLLMGQSNMAGRGIPEKEDLTPHPRVLLYNYQHEWLQAVEPVNKGEINHTAGVGPGLAFGKAMAESHPDVIIGLVPCAVGGTPLKRWEPGADLYSNAVARAHAVEKFGTISGIIWHQGESDTKLEADATSYNERIAKMITVLRAELKSPNLPFVVGQIGEFLYNREGNPLPYSKPFNEALTKLPEKVPHTACVLSKGLNHKGDQLHFDSTAERELGHRYATEMLRLSK